MNTNREKVVSRHSYMQKQLRGMRGPGPGLTVGIGRAAQETGRLASDFGRQVFLFIGLFLLVAIILAGTTGNQTFAHFVAWTGWFNN